ncbi:DNA internalization-related competence protein ComEC/Rec2 [Peptococcus simiae]|uniref:DNA internalization-related competence protein ComEC/Rec2 n=1 Tax=Peptococcus simiae TaxID=1643805 RepID=UPI00397FBE38
MWHLKRTGAWLALAFIIGRLLVAGVYWPLLAVPLLLWACRPAKWALPLAIIVALAGGLWGQGAVALPPVPLDTGQEVLLTAQVVKSTPTRQLVQVDRVDDRPLDDPFRVSLRRAYGDEDLLRRGQRIRVAASLESPGQRRAPGGFDEAQYLHGQGAFAVARAQEAVRALPPADSLPDRVARYMQAALDARLSPEGAALSRAILLGETAGLHPDFYHRAQLLGMVHVFAVSGLHVGMILGLIMALLRLLQVTSPWARLLLAAPLLIGYALMVGAPPSAIRAVVMAMLALLALGSYRYGDPPSILAYAGLALVLMDPFCLWQIGFQLSFTVTAGLLLFIRPLQRLLAPLPPALSSALAVALAAELAGAPLLAYYFNLWTPLSVLANVLFVPIVGVLVPLVLLGLLTGPFLPPLSLFLFWLADRLAALLIWLVQVPGAWLADRHVNIGAPVFYRVLLVYALLLLALVLVCRLKAVDWRHRVLALALPAVMVALLWAPVRDDLSCLVLDVGQGSCAFWQSPAGTRLLLDTGPGTDGAAAAMRALGVNRLDGVILSHGDSDHINGLARLLDDVRVDRLFIPAPLMKEEALQALVPRLADTALVPVADRERLSLKDLALHLTLLNSGEDEANANQLAAYLADSRLSLAGPGDSPAASLAHWDRPAADIFLVPHHGSRYSLDPADLRTHRPRLACCSAGPHNRYGHPHPQVRAAYRRAEIPFYLTAEAGSLYISRMPEGLEVRTPYA